VRAVAVERLLLRLPPASLTVRRAFALWLLALSLKLAGSAWDVAYHFRYPFDAFSLAHATNIAGFALAVALALHNLRELRAGRRAPLDAGSLRLVLCGLSLFALAAPFDQLWHALFGVDLTTWSPPHLALFAGTSLAIVGLLVGLHRQVGPGRFRTLGGFAVSAFLLEAVLFACSQQEYGAVSVYVLQNPAAAAAEGLVGPSAALIREARQYGSLEDLATGGLPTWLYPLFQLLAATFVLRLARHAVPWRATATSVALLYVGYRVVAQAVTDGAGLPQSFVPYHLIGVGLALDVAWRVPALAAAGAAAAVYGGVAALRLVEVGPPAPIGEPQALFLDGGVPVGIALAWAGLVAADALRRSLMSESARQGGEPGSTSARAAIHA
jgi:hypothetical protein